MKTIMDTKLLSIRDDGVTLEFDPLSGMLLLERDGWFERLSIYLTEDTKKQLVLSLAASCINAAKQEGASVQMAQEPNQF
jgi:hypothetical protein